MQNGLLSILILFLTKSTKNQKVQVEKTILGRGVHNKKQFSSFFPFYFYFKAFFYILVCIFRFLRSGNAIKVKMFTSGYILYVKLASILTCFLVFLIISVTCTMACCRVQRITSYIRFCHIGIKIVVFLWFSFALRGPRSALTHILHSNNTALT